MEEGTERAMQIVETEWKRLAPVRTGEYRDSISHTVTRVADNVVGTVFSASHKAEEIERGSGIYRSGPGTRRYIRPHPPRKAMRWFEDGKPVFARYVRGQRPQWVARRARINARPLVTVNMAAAAARAAREIRLAL
jgi:hypothetical protein